MKREYVELIIESYIWNLEEPKKTWKKDRFLYLSFVNWAAEELLKFVREKDYLDPIEAIELFIQKMNTYSCSNSNTSYIFSVASNTAEDILDHVLIKIL